MAAVKYSKKYKYWYHKKKEEEVFEADTSYTTFGSIPGRGLHSSTFELDQIRFRHEIPPNTS
jgi:hypothetical protein